MSEKNRRWFQIHLSTAVIVVLITGTVLGLNMRRSEPRIFEVPDTNSPLYPFINFRGGYGWPFSFQVGAFDYDYNRADGFTEETILATSRQRWRYHGIETRILAADIAICLTALSVAIFVLERAIRRREARKT